MSVILSPFALAGHCPSVISHGIRKIIDEPDLGPPSLIYADVLASKIAQKQLAGAYVSSKAHEYLRQLVLIFHLIKELNLQTDPSRENLKGPESAEDVDLWAELDRVLNMKWEQFHQHHLKNMVPNDSNEDELWYEFWECFRENGAKTTRPEVAGIRATGGSRLATQGCLPTLSDRILQEYDMFETYEKPKAVQKRLVTPCTPKTPCTPRKSSRGASRGESPTPRSAPKTPRTPTSKTTPRNSRRGSKEGGSYEKWGFNTDQIPGTLPPVQEHSQNKLPPATPRSLSSGRSSVACTPTLGGGRRTAGKKNQKSIPKLALPKLTEGKSCQINSFRSWEDYKVRQGAVGAPTLNDEHRELVEIATARPQVHASVAVREHRHACEWHRRGDVVHPSGAMTARAGFFQLPVVQASRSQGISAARNNMSIPSACFHRPWSREEGMVRKAKGGEAHRSAIERFAKVCVNTGVHPQPASIRFLVQLLPKIDIRAQGYADEDLLALGAALPSSDIGCRIEAVDFGENPRLSTQAVCTILRILADKHSGSLNTVRLDQCRHLGKQMVTLCTKLLKDQLKELQLLDLSGIGITLQEYTELARAIQRHRRLKDLRLANTHLGMFDKSHAAHVIYILSGTEHLEALDLGFNSLDRECFEILGKGLADSSKMVSLGLANTGPLRDPVLNGSPLLIFLEALARDRSLTSLDISNNALDYYAPLVLECAARRHPKLAQVDMSRNPVGLSGARALLRLMAYPECPDLTRITIQECSCGMRDGAKLGPWDPDPSGHYVMNMAYPVQRALLRLLLMRLSEGPNAVPPSKLMKSVVYKRDGVEQQFSFKMLKKGTGKYLAWEVPTEGVLDFELSAQEAVLGQDNPRISVTTKVERIVKRVRMQLKTHREKVAVLGQVKSVQDDEEQHNLLEALSWDFDLTPDQVSSLCKTKARWSNCGKDPVAVMKRLMPCLLGALNLRSFFQSVEVLGDILRVAAASNSLFTLNLENPTAHYRLVLSDPSDRSAAERLLILNRWELSVWKAHGRPDISQNGNFKNFRNELYGNREFIWSAEEWRLPGNDELSFDYLSLRRPDDKAKPVSDTAWKAVVDRMRDALYCPTRQVGIRMEIQRQAMMDRPDLEEAGAASDSENPGKVTADGSVQASTGDQNAMESLQSAEQPVIQKVMTQMESAQEAVLKMKSSTTSEGGPPSTSSGSSSSIGSDDEEENQRGLRLKESDILVAIRSVGSRHWLTSRQLRRLLVLLKEPSSRVEVLSSLVLRCVDWPMNGKICRPKFTKEDWAKVQRKLGYIVLFPFFQPEHAEINLDLRFDEQRRAMATFVSLQNQENPNNISKARIDWNGPRAEPAWDTFIAGVPLSWDTFDNVPGHGIFEGVFNSSADNVRLHVRRKLASTVGGWTNLPEDRQTLKDSVHLWANIEDMPEEVVQWANFCVSKYPSLVDTFKACDKSGDGNLSLSEFTEGFLNLGFRLPPDPNKPDKGRARRNAVKRSASRALSMAESVISEMSEHSDENSDKFKGDTPSPRLPRKDKKFARVVNKVLETQSKAGDERCVTVLTSVYRYLDPNNDGAVSLPEFLSLQGMWRELRQATWEFVDHVTQVFGSLEQAWEFADEDGSGEIDYEEFARLARKWQYDGPLHQIYMYLDGDGSNSIGKAEWLTLSEVTQG